MHGSRVKGRHEVVAGREDGHGQMPTSGEVGLDLYSTMIGMARIWHEEASPNAPNGARVSDQDLKPSRDSRCSHNS